jgi:hypothetical protein
MWSTYKVLMKESLNVTVITFSTDMTWLATYLNIKTIQNINLKYFSYIYPINEKDVK